MKPLLPRRPDRRPPPASPPRPLPAEPHARPVPTWALTGGGGLADGHVGGALLGGLRRRRPRLAFSWFVDPHSVGQRRQSWQAVGKPLGMGPVGSFKDGRALGALGLGESIVDIVGREEADAGVVVLGVVPGEEVPTVGAGVFVGAKAVGEIRAVLHGLEMPLGERIVVGNVGARMALGDAQVSHQEGHRLRGHGRATVSMQGELAGVDVVAPAGLLDEGVGNRSTLAAGEGPAHDVAAEDVD